jgi:hypothetical protein
LKSSMAGRWVASSLSIHYSCIRILSTRVWQICFRHNFFKNYSIKTGMRALNNFFDKLYLRSSSCPFLTKPPRTRLQCVHTCTVPLLNSPWSSPKKHRFRKFWRSYLDQNLLRITNPVSDLTGDQ